MELTTLKNKYPFLQKITGFKFWGIVLGVALIIQVVFVVLLSYKAFVFFTGIIFWGMLWYIAAFLFRHISPKWKLTLHSTFVVLMLVEIFLRLSGMVANYAEDRFGHYESFYSLSRHTECYINPPSDTNLDFDGNEFMFKRKTNNFGYCDKAWVWENMKEKTRILGLGDSFTAGDGTHKDSTWLKFFERKLNDTSYYFMNGGMVGSDPVFMAYNLKNTFSQFRPHGVIVCINDTDISDIILRGGFERFDEHTENMKQPPWWEPIFAASHVLRNVIYFKFNTYFIDRNKIEQEEDKSLAIIKQAMDSVQTYCRNNSAQAVFVFHPSKFCALNNNNPFHKFTDTLNVGSAVVIDLYEHYQQADIKNNIDEYYWKEDGHHNARGYELMVDGIYKGIKEHHLLDSIDY